MESIMDSNTQAAQQDSSLLLEVDQMSREKIQNCYQCQKCSAGCPLNFAMDILPNQMFRHIQYGHREKVLTSKTIWLCASCHTCSVRCPNSIDIAKVMDTLRSMSLRYGFTSGEKKISLFHKFFLGLTKYTGRTWEPGFALYELKSGGLGGFMGWGLKAVLRGRMGFFPTFKGGKEFRKLFNKPGKGGAR
jgi:heterodisulfide reductase subunit C